MKDKNQKHFLDDTVKRAKIENAHREAENIYNYNKWKDNHEKMVDHELKKMQHKDHKVIKAVLIGILLALIIEIVYIFFFCIFFNFFENLMLIHNSISLFFLF